MGDESTGRDSRHQLPILLGVVGAVLGFVGAAFLAPFNRMDPMTSGLIALFVFGPIGAVIGAFAGAKLGRLIRPNRPAAESVAAAPPAGASTGTTTSNAFKALGITFGTAAVLIGAYAFYSYQTATPWLRPNGTMLQFEVRLPAGAPMPPASGVKAELQTSENTMPAEMKPSLFRSDGGQPVIVGNVDLAFRSSWRQLEVKIPGRADTTYALKLATSPSHSSSLGSWQRHPDGSEIRYRVKWPGQE